MTVAEIDSESVDGRVKSGKAAWEHIESEYLDVVDDIIATLVPDGPYAYTLPWDYTDNGTIPYQHFATDLATLREGYESLHRVTVVRSLQAIAEVRSDWYTFCYGLGEGLVKPTGQIAHTPTAVLFPTMGQSGITGELIWRRCSTGAPFTGGNEGPLAAETAVLGRHEAYLDCLRRGDAEGAAALHHADAQIGVRDYITDSGTIAGMHSSAEYRAFLEQLFARYEIVDVQMVERVGYDWFVFAELLWLVREKGGARRVCKFHTIDIAEVLPDGLFASRIGHGTEVVPV